MSLRAANVLFIDLLSSNVLLESLRIYLGTTTTLLHHDSSYCYCASPRPLLLLTGAAAVFCWAEVSEADLLYSR
ncbi:hypothetical protein BDZ85DRAFT_18403 [Elsinoe ampelina]|uniref:Uncharacterized protein n=1 Tax=Elsinoe ampelina TaxID=302913 RepID=A0A6A6G720_9PEZI|nr:hypothetical protein BDZ85DRAFT_18403 [Elsinoe ampelina]